MCIIRASHCRDGSRLYGHCKKVSYLDHYSYRSRPISCITVRSSKASIACLGFPVALAGLLGRAETSGMNSGPATIHVRYQSVDRSRTLASSACTSIMTLIWCTQQRLSVMCLYRKTLCIQLCTYLAFKCQWTMSKTSFYALQFFSIRKTPSLTRFFSTKNLSAFLMPGE